jgi:hypothetical protein
MKGDFTRFRFDPVLHRRRVYMQQGRVAVDADANEGSDIAEYLREVGIRDVVGPSGAPLAGGGLAITAAGSDLQVGAGRYWVDGLLVENETQTTLGAQPYLPAGTSPVAQADGTVGAAPSDGVYLVFLETWERLVTAVDDDSLREPALGGPDTTARTQQVWQVRLLRAGGLGTPFTCSENLADWNTLTGAPGVTMAARSAVSAAPPNDCTVPAAAGFRGTENQHYRVEIHDPGNVNNATFVWSRENGSVVSRWTARSGNNLTVSSPGRDGSLGFAPGDWVELIDEMRELTGVPGTLVRLTDARGDRLVIDAPTATGTVDFAQFPRNPRVRRWDSDGPQKVRVPAQNGGWLPLELGVEVHWPAAGTFRTGQWWSVAARTVLGDVIWPQTGGNPATLTPFGEQHHFARLAVAQLQAGAWTVLSDCRNLFPPLTGLESLFMLGGDGQEVLPDVANAATLVPLAAPLRVGVSIGKSPVANAPVRFSVSTGNGQVNGGATTQVLTGADGVASVSWSVDSGTALQVVTAQLVDDLGTALHLPVQFDASLSVASDVAYEPGCAELTGTKTVQEAIDKLCAVGGEGCATVVLAPGENWWAPLVALAAGSDAHVCFRPGTYTTPQPVVLANLGSLVVSGSGAGSRVVAPQAEVALLFRDCQEVTLRDLAIESGVVGVSPERPGLNGALTFEGCRRVVVENAEIRCAAATKSRAGACVTARASAKTRPDVVRLRDCELVVGHLQLGALVLDAERTSVTGTTMRVAPKPQALTFDALLADADRRGALLRQLISRARATTIAAGEPATGFNTLLDAGGFTVAFNSSVPQTEWNKLAAAHPPTDANLASKEAVEQWASGLASQAISNPQSLPSFNRQLKGLQKQLGEGFAAAVGSDVGHAILHSSLILTPIVAFEPGAAAGPGAITVQLGAASVQLESVISADDWLLLLAAGGVTGAATGAVLKQQMESLGRQAITSAALRSKVPALVQWFQRLAARNVDVASAGVVVGGGRAESVTVSDNMIIGVLEVVHVGLHAGDRKAADARRRAGRVVIRGNRATMRIPFELLRGPRGYFVGNAQHVVVADNEMQFDAGRSKRSDVFLEGVRLWGEFGPRIRVDDNLLDCCETGVRVQPQSLPSPPPRVRWSVSGNVAPHATAGVVAPASVLKSGNVP